jgi:hypothetical protein
MFSIALVVVFGFAFLLALLAAGGMFLVGYMEKQRGAPRVGPANRSASTSSDVTLYLRADGDPAALFGGHELRAREGLLDASALSRVCESLAAQAEALRGAAVVYAAPRFFAPYDDGLGGAHYRLRVRSRRPLRTIGAPIHREALRASLLEMASLESSELIAAHLELVAPKRERALPRLEALA